MRKTRKVKAKLRKEQARQQAANTPPADSATSPVPNPTQLPETFSSEDSDGQELPAAPTATYVHPAANYVPEDPEEARRLAIAWAFKSLRLSFVVEGEERLGLDLWALRRQLLEGQGAEVIDNFVAIHLIKLSGYEVELRCDDLGALHG